MWLKPKKCPALHLGRQDLNSRQFCFGYVNASVYVCAWLGPSNHLMMRVVATEAVRAFPELPFAVEQILLPRPVAQME